MRHNIIHNEDGLTLMELIVVIAILGIVLSMVFSFLMFGMKSLQYGSGQIEDQGNLRLTAYKITDEIRNVRSVNLLASGGTVTKDEHIYLSSNKVIHNDATSADMVMSHDLIADMSFTLSVENELGLLTITLHSVEGEELITDVLLNNITMDASDPSTNGVIIEYDFNAP